MAFASAPTRTGTASLYEVDFSRWAAEQAHALREDRQADVDWENLAEEIESLGRRDRRAIENRLEILLAHLLKCVVQPERRTASWDATIKEQRKRIRGLIDRNPSLKELPGEYYDTAYREAVWRAYRDTGVHEEAFPAKNPFSLRDALDPDYIPD